MSDPCGGVTGRRHLLAIIELGGYPNFAPLYSSEGFQVTTLTAMRKALSFLKKNKPDVIVAEFNYQTDFRDRSSNLESLMARLQHLPEVRVIVFFQRQHGEAWKRFQSRFNVFAGLEFPVSEQALRECLRGLPL